MHITYTVDNTCFELDRYKAYLDLLSTVDDKIPILTNQVIGVTGGVGSGKTTFSKLLKQYLESKHAINIATISTDSFIYSNQYLKANALFHEKGFPHTFDLAKLYRFILSIQNKSTFNEELFAYSQQLKDLDFNRPLHFDFSNDGYDLVILEGINLMFYLKHGLGLTILDKPIINHLNFSIYLNPPHEVLRQRLRMRFIKAFKEARESTQPPLYFVPLLDKSESQINTYIDSLWHTNDLKLLISHIEPNMHLSDLLIDIL